MGIWTKVFLGGLGWAVGGPIGGLIGYALGSVISAAKSTKDSQPQIEEATQHGPYRNTGTQADLDAALMVLITAMMKADGVVRRSELDYVKKFLLNNYGEERGKEMLQLIHKLQEQQIPVDSVCQQIKVNTNYTTRYQMFDFLFGLAGADGEFSTSELALIYRISVRLGISRSDYASCYERHVGNADSSSRGTTSDNYDKDPYRVLGIDSSATDDEVRRAYRRMAMKYHPDKVADMGEEMQRSAAEQMKEINRAYEIIKQRRSSLK